MKFRHQAKETIYNPEAFSRKILLENNKESIDENAFLSAQYRASQHMNL